jgi:hypothetical protein
MYSAAKLIWRVWKKEDNPEDFINTERREGGRPYKMGRPS